jgi:CxxC motif-containing protein (DUF1111 family)
VPDYRSSWPRNPSAATLLIWLASGCSPERGDRAAGPSTLGPGNPTADEGSGGTTTPGAGGPPPAGDAPPVSAGGATGGAPLNGPAPDLLPLFDAGTPGEPAIVEDTTSALITRFSDRARDRHAREDQFQSYEHYLPHYWEHRIAEVEIVDPIGKGGDTITFNVTTHWKLDDNTADLRCFYRGIGTVAEYHDNRSMTPVGDLSYQRVVPAKFPENRPLEVGDEMEFELSQFLDAPPRGRDNYYGTVFLYVVGKGLVPWEGTGERRDSNPIVERAWAGGRTTVHRNESDEPDNLFMQMATNTAPQNGARFLLGRRIAHTSFTDGSHDESSENPIWTEQIGKAGPNRIHHSCNGCHEKNGRALPAEVGIPLDQYVFRVADADGNPDPHVGAVLQPEGEGVVRLGEWAEDAGLRRPIFAFDGTEPARFSARISPQLVGLGLLEAIPESALVERADPDDEDGDGISGRPHVVTDYDGVRRLGRFGWKAGQPTVRQQVAGALRTDLGVLTSLYSTPDCGTEQSGCGPSGAELDDASLDDLSLYVALLGVQPQRGVDDPRVLQGAEAFAAAGCGACHAPTAVTSEWAELAELRGQTIHPYTDLLLHDMGAGLSDTLGEGDAAASEWRTSPLWSIGLTAGVSGGEAYLHDGRARTLTEAILWHGGEAERSRVAFESLSADDQDALIAFLKSL